MLNVSQGCAPVTAQLFLWPEDSRLVVADIEGMILQTGKLGKPRPGKAASASAAAAGMSNGGEGRAGNAASNAGAGQATSGWGSFFSFGSGFESTPGAATTDATQLLHDIAKNGYHIVYIATKSMTQSSSTKIELVKATEKSSSRLPPGPVFLSPDTLLRSFDPQRPDIFKAAVLRGTRSLYPASHNPFYSGFCTNVNDMNAFLRCGFPEGRTFFASETGEAKVMKNMITKWTYKDMHSLLHEIFPSYYDNHRSGGNTSKKQTTGTTTEDLYNDFNFWKIPPFIA
jgi:phosphatidate phosphatase PAH1